MNLIPLRTPDDATLALGDCEVTVPAPAMRHACTQVGTVPHSPHPPKLTVDQVS